MPGPSVSAPAEGNFCSRMLLAPPPQMPEGLDAENQGRLLEVEI